MKPETRDHIQLSNVSVRIMQAMLIEHGRDPRPAIHAAGVDSAAIEDPAGHVSGRQELEFQRAFVALTADRPDIWFQTGLRYRLIAYGSFGFAMMTARSLRRAIDIATASGDLHYSLLSYSAIEEDGHLCGMKMDASAAPADLREFSTYRALGSIATMLNDMWRGVFPLGGIELEITESSIADYLRDSLHTKITFGAARNAWLWPPQIEDEALPMSNELLESTYAEQCRALIRQLEAGDPLIKRALWALPLKEGGYADAETLARRLGIAERSLQRELQARGVSYRALLERTREQQARDLLTSTDLSVEKIAMTLGYSELAVLSRAFKRWTGVSPSDFRAQLRRRDNVS